MATATCQQGYPSALPFTGMRAFRGALPARAAVTLGILLDLYTIPYKKAVIPRGLCYFVIDKL